MWWIVLCYFRDAHILQKCGPDAVQYLKFQRYLMVYMAIVTVLSIAVILPCNFQGDLGKALDIISSNFPLNFCQICDMTL